MHLLFVHEQALFIYSNSNQIHQQQIIQSIMILTSQRHLHMINEQNKLMIKQYLTYRPQLLDQRFYQQINIRCLILNERL